MVAKKRSFKLFGKKTAAKPIQKRRPLTEEEKFERDTRKARAIQRKRAKRERLIAVFSVLLAVYIGIIGIIAAYGILSFNSVALAWTESATVIATATATVLPALGRYFI